MENSKAAVVTLHEYTHSNDLGSTKILMCAILAFLRKDLQCGWQYIHGQVPQEEKLD